jgi:hypothetical protein
MTEGVDAGYSVEQPVEIDVGVRIPRKRSEHHDGLTIA